METQSKACWSHPAYFRHRSGRFHEYSGVTLCFDLSFSRTSFEGLEGRRPSRKKKKKEKKGKKKELDYIPLMRYGIGRQRLGQPANTVMLNLNKLRVEKFSWQWSVGRVTVTRLSTWYDVTWRNMTWRDMTWHYVTCHDVTWWGKTWRDMTWRDMTWHDVTLRDMIWRDHETESSVPLKPEVYIDYRGHSNIVAQLGCQQWIPRPRKHI